MIKPISIPDNSRLLKTGARFQQILLADDDIDDCHLFQDALAELPVTTQLTTVHDGIQLMLLLNKNNQLPDLLFLDLNMHRKNGYACLEEIKQNEKLKQLPVIILSTSFEQGIVTQLYKNGAQHYIRKPNEFSQLKNLIHSAIKLSSNANFGQPSIENFVLLLEPNYYENK